MNVTHAADLTDQIDRVCVPLNGDDHDYDDLLDAVGDRSIVLLGEATHGTHEFYRERARITRRLIEEFARRPDPAGASAASAVLSQLTEREREVLVLVARGQSNAEIAAALFVSYATVKTHVSHLLMKLDARDRAQLVMIAYETGVVMRGAV